MAVNDYTAQQAFELLMKHLRERDDRLATHVQAVVDAGKDVDETEQVGRRRKRSRSYRKTVPYSYEEALKVALDALQAYFIEQPLFVDSCAKNMATTQLASPRLYRAIWQSVEAHKDDVATESIGKPKKIEIELRTETQISRPGQEMFQLREIDVTQIEKQKGNLAQLKTLVDFEA